MMQRQILVCLGSGVLYAAFLQNTNNFHPFILLLSLFLPILLFIPAITLGITGVALSTLPIILTLFFSNPESILSFLMINTTPALLVGYIFYEQHRLKKENNQFFGIQSAVEKAAYGQILFFCIFLLLPKTWELIDTAIQRIDLIIQQMQHLNTKISASQFSIFIPMIYIFLNVYCIRLSIYILKKTRSDFINLEEEYTYSPWIDIPVLFFLLLITLSDILMLPESVKFIINIFLILSIWPVLFLGIQVFKTIGHYYGFSKNIIHIALIVLFFLVHPLMFIVLLGLMESSSSISQRFRRKHF
jgi:hypothetical protein